MGLPILRIGHARVVLLRGREIVLSTASIMEDLLDQPYATICQLYFNAPRMAVICEDFSDRALHLTTRRSICFEDDRDHSSWAHLAIRRPWHG